MLRKRNRWRKRRRAKVVKRLLASNRYPGRNKHHLIPRSLGGPDAKSNMLLIDVHKHELWHQLWGNRTIDEVLDLLTRMARAKRRQARWAA